MRKGEERKAAPVVMVLARATPLCARAAGRAAAGARRMRKASGTITTKARAAMVSIEARQSMRATSQAANGDMVSGAMPMPAETSETARLLCVLNQPVTVAIRGGRIAETATPVRPPKAIWNTSRFGARLASARPKASSAAPIRMTGRGPMRSIRMPQPMADSAITRKPIVMAVDMPVRDHSVAAAIGTRKTGSENIDPMCDAADQPAGRDDHPAIGRVRNRSLSHGVPRFDFVKNVGFP